MKLNDTLACWNCSFEFRVDDADMCDGCNPCEDCRQARSVSDGCYFSCCSHTLACPSCGKCACSKLDEWNSRGKLRRIDGHERFAFVHSDLLSETST